LRDKFSGEQIGQEAFDATPGHHQIGRQVGVHRMSDLIDVVSDASQLGEQGRVHRAVRWPRAHIDLAFENKPLAQPRRCQAELAGLRNFLRIVIIGHADADHLRAGALLVCPSSRHCCLP